MSMLTKERVVRLLQEQTAYLANEFGVRRIGLFGSASRGQSTEASDIDLVVQFNGPLACASWNWGTIWRAYLDMRLSC